MIRQGWSVIHDSSEEGERRTACMLAERRGSSHRFEVCIRRFSVELARQPIQLMPLDIVDDRIRQEVLDALSSPHKEAYLA